MKQLSITLMALALTLTASAQSFTATPKATAYKEAVRARWIRRLTGIASCAISGYDAYQTNKYVTNGNGHYVETGQVGSGGGLIGIKVGACVGPLVAGEIWGRKNQMVSMGATGISAGTAVMFGIAVKHNQGQIQAGQAEQAK